MPSTSVQLNPDKDSLVFQCLDLQTMDCLVINDSSSFSSSSRGSIDSDEPKKVAATEKHFQILLFGTDALGSSICLQVEDYRPYFYVRIPDCLADNKVYQTHLEGWFRELVPEHIQSSITIRLEYHKTLWDYNGGKMSAFFRIEVPSLTVWRSMRDLVMTKQCTPRVHETKKLFGTKAASVLPTINDESFGYLSKDRSRIGLKVYEANIDPVLRFFHERDIAPAGWITVPPGEWEWTDGSSARASIRATCNWKSVSPFNKNSLSPLTIASWDIECTSSHGDFPMASKTWRKSIRELAELREKCPATIEDLCEELASAIRGDQSGVLSPVYLKKTTAAFGPKTFGETIRLVFEGKQVLKKVAIAISGLRIATNSKAREDAILVLDKLLTDSLPSLRGDEIIQIGTVLYKQGAPISKHIWVLGDVDSNAIRPPGAEVPIHAYSFRDELAMLKSWIKWVGDRDPDVMIGYNIFGFDERYVWDRIRELTVNEKQLKEIVAPWSRLRSRPPKLEEKFLSSSAMGDNTMYILGSVGRLQIDLLPYVRRSYNLDSYTLDNVSATFVSGAVNSTLKQEGGDSSLFKFSTKSTKGTVVGRYITLMDAENDRVVDRCEVVGVEPKALTVRIEGGQAVLDDHGLAAERWAQVKDDVSPKDIFRLHRGSAADRAIVAKYCFPESDHQLLTNRGYMFLKDIEKIWGPDINGPPQDKTLKFAGFNPVTQQLVYETPKCLVINDYAENQDMVEFTQSAYSSRWEHDNHFGLTESQLHEYELSNITGNDDSAYRGPNFVSVITTPDHDMYARIGAATGKVGYMRMTTGKARTQIPFAKVKADKLLNTPEKTAIKFLGQFKNGVYQPDKITIDREKLGLVTETQYNRFLELYGYWLGDGHLLFNHKSPASIAFAIVKESDRKWLEETFAILDLKQTSVYKRETTYPDQIPGRLKRQAQYNIKICDSNYIDFFFTEYGRKYKAGEGYNSESDASKNAKSLTKCTLAMINAIKSGDAIDVSHDEVVVDESTAMQDDGVRSAKWLMPWVWSLEKAECRAIVSGLIRADGSHHNGNVLKHIFTSSARFRDEIERLALHGGYSPYSTVCYLAGSQRGVTHEGNPIIANHTLWQINFPEDIQFAEPTLKQRDGDVKSIKYTGRTWCVSMPSTFVVARRARTVNGFITHASRPIVTGNCLQDCDLVMELFNKLDILNNSIAMANVCSVPVSYIFLRGQGIKIESLIFKECRRVDQLIEVMPSAPRDSDQIEMQPENDSEDEDDGGEDTYEGAIVLQPNTGIYIDDPVTADDFASLYPSSIISENISHDTMIWVKDYSNDGKFICVREGSDRYDNLPGEKYVNIEFDILRPDPMDKRKHPQKIRDGKRIARYIQAPQGTIPRILEMLLASRKKCRKLAETEPDEFARNLLDAQQLAYKLTANSLYGQLGSGTFKVRRQVLAASTTAYGRKQLMYAKAVIEEVYGGGRDPRCDVECVYGDTDSIFLRFRPCNPVTGERLHGYDALKAAKDLTIESGQLVSSCLKSPHDFEFDKIFRTFCLLSKKRYVGDMSEDGIEEEDFHRKSMGIVMKRRDNAPIVKYVYGHAIDCILDPKRMDVGEGVREAAAFVQQASRDLLAGKFPLTKLTITKSLRSEYADPTRIAHKVLADRIAERDPGNKPSTSDRIPFVYIQNVKAKLQGERIELPSYIREHKLRPDYAHYITNQIAKPVAQVFALALEHLTNVSPAEIRACEKARDPVTAREKLAEKALFEKYLVEAAREPEAMEARGQKSIASFFGKKLK
jgi:DNA polymerase elongation subunit (family B)